MNYLYEALEKPTRLYIKQCPHCGLKYFGKTVKKEIEKYQGSGVHWSRHLKKHNVEPKHLWNSDWYYDTSITRFALRFSKLNKIVESDSWANATDETGLGGSFWNGEDNPSKTKVKDGTHHFILNNPSISRVKDGTHNLLGGEQQRRQVENGTHHFITNNPNVARVNDGTHHFLGGDLQRKRVANGTHPFVKNHPNKSKFKCTYTGVVSTKSGFTLRAKNKGLDKWPYELEEVL